MNPEEFRSWRKHLGWKQREAADRLGLKKRVIQYYEKGDRDGKPVEIPKTVALACLALALGYDGYDASKLKRAKTTKRKLAEIAPDSAPEPAPAEAQA